MLYHRYDHACSVIGDHNHDVARQKISEAIECIVNESDCQENIVMGVGKNILSPKPTFFLVIQTKFQKGLLVKYGNTISMMDAIYHTTKYGSLAFF